MGNADSTLSDVISKDGTTVGFDRLGEGPAVVLVSGGSVDRQSNAGVAALLAGNFTVFNYDRRGRGPSGDTPPYAVVRMPAGVRRSRPKPAVVGRQRGPRTHPAL